MGQADLEKYSGYEDSSYAWLVFFLITFCIQLLYLNMIIAIMGNVFDLLLDNKHIKDVKDQLDRLSWASIWLPQPKEEKRFWYLAVPITK